MTTISYATCHLCEASCGIAVEHDGERILKIRGDEEDPFSRGYICPKATALADVHADPDRLRRPVRRTARGWEEIGWDEALDEAAGRLAEIQGRHGRDAVGLYVGNPTAHSYTATLFLVPLLAALRTRSMFSSNSVDALPRLLTSLSLYGSQAVLPVPDLERTSFLLVLGANPVVSNGSIMTAPGCARRLKELRARGGRLVVVDPRRTETAEIADEHHFIRPGADALLLLGMLHALFAEGRVTLGQLAPRLDGAERVRALCAPFSPERVAPATGMAAATIRDLARRFAEAPAAVCYGRMGVSTQAFGAVSCWLIDLLNLLTGNVDRPGGAMFSTPAVDLPALAALVGQTGSFDRWRSRVRGLPEFNGELPAATMAEEIETPGEGQVRALITHAGNPVLSTPNGRRLDRALAGLEYMVAIDIYRNETTRHAHLILPPTFGLERDHYPLLVAGFAVRNVAKLSQAVLPRDPGARGDWEILLGLTTRLLERQGPGGRAGAAALGWIERRGPRAVLREALRVGPWGRRRGAGGRGLTLEALLESPHGVDLGPLEPRLPGILRTRGRRIRLDPPRFVADLARVEAALAGAEAAAAGRAPDELLLIGRRQLRSNNSWMHNSLRLVKGPRRCTLQMHPDDAQQRGLRAGDRARVSSRVGAVVVEVEVSDAMMPGVVSLPHGWGHDREGIRLGVAQEHAGVSVNDLTDEAARDELSGVAVLSGVPVTVTAAAREAEAEAGRAGADARAEAG